MIVVNLLGNGVSTSPSNVAPPDDRDRYPVVTVFDNVKAQAALLDHLGGESVRKAVVELPSAARTYRVARFCTCVVSGQDCPDLRLLDGRDASVTLGVSAPRSCVAHCCSVWRGTHR
eukprot:COSAG02_NODE_3552_length_6575_cov_3.200432_5_plen_117_part_00